MNNEIHPIINDSILNSAETTKYLIEFSKYLYQEEIKRSDRFSNAVKTYLIFTMTTFTVNFGAVKLINNSFSGFFTGITSFKETLVGAFFFTSLISNLLAFLFTILVIKTWRTEGICNPMRLYTTLSELQDDRYLLKEILIDFLVAAQLNAEVNDSKAKFLSLAAKTYFLGVFLLVMGGGVYVYY
jgi:hypothetical protein